VPSSLEVGNEAVTVASTGRSNPGLGQISWRFYLPPLLVGLAIRLCYALVATQPPIPTGADQYYYQGQATLITHGHWWVVPGSVVHGSTGIPGAAHPPLFSAILAIADYVGLHGNNGQRAFLCVLGLLAIVCCGRIGARLAGHTGEVVVTWVAAVWPGMWIYNGEVLSESVTVVLVAATLLAFYRLHEKQTSARAVVLGLAVALCALTRPELLILVVVFAPLWLPTTSLGRRVSVTAVFLFGAVVLVGPWVGRNLHDYSHTEIISANFGSVIVGANCGPTYSGPLLGAWDATCATSLRPPIGDASVADSYYRSVGTHYARTHLSRVPVVVAARLGRALGVWPAPAQSVTWNATAAGVWPRWSSWLYLVTWWISIPFAIVGAISLRRRSMVGWPLYALIALYLVVSAVLYADPRFASSCQPALTVLVGVGLASLIRAVFRPQGAHARLSPLDA
jgi:Dolichyl-phosphate-mannose-protein mannosyltransferase